MSTEFPNGVQWYTTAEFRLTVHFPEDKVKCRYCEFCRSEGELKRFWCRLANNMLYAPDVPGLPEWCPIGLTGEWTVPEGG